MDGTNSKNPTSEQYDELEDKMYHEAEYRQIAEDEQKDCEAKLSAAEKVIENLPVDANGDPIVHGAEYIEAAGGTPRGKVRAHMAYVRDGHQHPWIPTENRWKSFIPVEKK